MILQNNYDKFEKKIIFLKINKIYKIIHLLENNTNIFVLLNSQAFLLSSFLFYNKATTLRRGNVSRKAR